MSLEIAVAAPFRSMRKERLRKSEIVYFLAIDRKWMNRDQANQMIVMGVQAGLLKEEGEYLIPLFDPAAVTIPLGYRPPPMIFERRDACQELIERIAASRTVEEQEIAAAMNALNQKHFDGRLRAEAAAVVLARHYGVIFDDLRGELKKNMKKGGC